MASRTAPQQQRDAQGNRLCRMPTCLKPVPKRRISYCSDACATEFEIAYFPSRARIHVRRRDHGVCAKCRCDTEKIQRVFRWVQHWAHKINGTYNSWRDARSVLRELGFKGSLCHRGDFWQADHVKEVVRGGWGLGLDNFRTLCTPCHNEESARLAGELAEERRRAKGLPPPPPSLFDAPVTGDVDGPVASSA